MSEYSLERDEKAQKEWAIRRNNGLLAIPGVRFETEREARRVMDALEDAADRATAQQSEPVPNTPDQHESVKAVKGQEPRA